MHHRFLVSEPRQRPTQARVRTPVNQGLNCPLGQDVQIPGVRATAAWTERDSLHFGIAAEMTDVHVQAAVPREKDAEPGPGSFEDQFNSPGPNGIYSEGLTGVHTWLGWVVSVSGRRRIGAVDPWSLSGHGLGPTLGPGSPSGSSVVGGQGADRAADRLGDGMSDREDVWTPWVRRVHRWARNALAPPALSVQTRMGVPWRRSSGIWASAASRTVMWSAAVLAPALPGRSSQPRASPVLSRKHNSGW